MADNVDISLKLGTEADISSAINAGARAGAAFAAAAQSAVNGISLSTSTSMRAFATSTRQISSNADVSQEIRKLGLTNGLIAQLAVARASGGGSGNNGGWGSKPFAPAFPDPRGGNNLPQNQWRFTYSGWKQIPGETPNIIDAEFYERTEKSVTNIDKVLTKTFGRGGGGGGPIVPYYQTTGDQISKPPKKFDAAGSWNAYLSGLAYGKFAEEMLRPFAEYYTATSLAGYQAHTDRSARGFRNERLANKIADIDLESKVGSRLGFWGLTGAGALFGGLPGAILMGIIGGAAELLIGAEAENAKNRLKESNKQQEKTLSESQKRYLNANLFGFNYNTSYQEAMDDLGLGLDEGSTRAMAGNALTFRARQAFGQVGLHEYTMLAQVPNYFAAINSGVTDPETLHKLLKHDLNNLGDDSMAAYIASQLPGIGLDVWGGLKSDAYDLATNSVNSRVMVGENRRANRVIGDYITKNSQNAVDTTIAQSAQMVIDRYNAPASFAVGYGVTKDQLSEAQTDYNMSRQSVMRNGVAYTGNTFVINVSVDGEQIHSETVKEKDFVTGGMSYAVGGN